MDLSAGPVSFDKQALLERQLREEDQRLRWKTAVLWGSFVSIVVFFGSLLVYVLSYRKYWINTASQNLIIAILAAIPTLLAINLMRMVGKPNRKEDDFESSPWISLLRELIDAIRQK